MNIGQLWRIVIGNPLETEDLDSEKLTKTRGLAVLASDALSSTAYATEEMMKVLVLAGVTGLALTQPLSIAIVILIAILGFSYFRTIHAYPQGGGAYTVAHENLGALPGLIAAAALLVDYALTVAVSISSGVSQISSAFPAFLPYEVHMGVFFVAVITLLNLRGMRESSTIFAIPTYLFIFIYGFMVVYGLYQMFSGQLAETPPTVLESTTGLGFNMHTLTLFLILKAFSSGCSALTGIEAVSNGVQAFNPPQAKNANKVLFVMLSILALFFIGTSYLAQHLGLVPSESETVVSMVARKLFGESIMYYATQFVTTAILILAANTAYTGFPRLSSILASDRYLPRQMASLGDRLVYSNGIIFLGFFVSGLIILYHANTHGLVPLYMVGVFVTFTLSQTGMVRFWWKKRSPKWWFHMSINALGALCTFVVGLVVLVVKFFEWGPESLLPNGAWITFLAITALVIAMLMIRKHYEEFSVQISLNNAKAPRPYVDHKVVIPISDVHRGVLEAVRYAQTISKDVTALYVDLGQPERLERLRTEWQKWVPEVPIIVLPSPFRSVIRPIIHHLDDLREGTSFDTAVTVVIPEFVPLKWWHHLLHNQTAWMLKIALLFHRKQNKRYKVLADVPYYLRK